MYQNNVNLNTALFWILEYSENYHSTRVYVPNLTQASSHRQPRHKPSFFHQFACYTNFEACSNCPLRNELQEIKTFNYQTHHWIHLEGVKAGHIISYFFSIVNPLQRLGLPMLHRNIVCFGFHVFCQDCRLYRPWRDRDQEPSWMKICWNTLEI